MNRLHFIHIIQLLHAQSRTKSHSNEFFYVLLFKLTM